MRLRLAVVTAILVTTVPYVSAEDARSGLATANPIGIHQSDWPWWRGPNRNGIAAPNQRPPLKWSDSENVRWSVPVAGRGHSSPTVVEHQVFLTTADEDLQTQAVLCFDRQTGEQLWSTTVHRGGLPQKLNEKASHASSTVACDGDRLFINFLNNGAVYTTALTRDGRQLWQRKISEYVVHQGYGSSPAVYGSLVVVSADNKSGGAIVALDRISGEQVWRNERPKFPNYASPIILRVADRQQLLLIGGNRVTSFEPLTGEPLWETEGATTECVTSTVSDGQHIFTSGGYPRNHVSAVRADGSGQVVWQNKSRVYVPSMLVRDGRLYGVLDAGVAVCWISATGKQVWRGRLGGTFSASPTMVGDHIFATNETGTTYVFKTSTDRFEVVAQNQLGDQVMATPTFCNSQIFMRVVKQPSRDGQGRQEMLYCLGEGPGPQ